MVNNCCNYNCCNYNVTGYLSHSHLSTTQLDNVSLSLKEEIEGLLQKLRAESATQEFDSTYVQITGTSDSDKPPLK